MRIRIIGTGVDAITLHGAVDEIVSWASSKRGGVVLCRASGGLVQCREDPIFQAYHETADLVTPDGMPLVWILKLKAGRRAVTRVYGPELMLRLCEATADTVFRHFFFGSTTQVCERLVDKLRGRCPSLKVAGFLSPPFTSISEKETECILKTIRSTEPDFIWVGLGSPKQEAWISQHREKFPSSVLLGVGAAFDFVSGSKRQAPRAIRQLGFEWAYRFVQEPRRLWRRNLIDNPRFLYYLLKSSVATDRN